MKQIVKYAKCVELLEKIFKRVNEKYFNGELEVPVITIQKTRGSYGHVTVFRTWKSNDKTYRELNVNPEYLDRELIEILCTIEHEMVHIYNLQNGIKDVSNNGAYHNQKFKEKAESIGLKIDCVPVYGWTLTSPTIETFVFCEELKKELKIDHIGIYALRKDLENTQGKENTDTEKKGGNNTSDGNKIRTSSTRKYKCPCCGLKIRATKIVKVICAECNEIFVEFE